MIDFIFFANKRSSDMRFVPPQTETSSNITAKKSLASLVSTSVLLGLVTYGQASIVFAGDREQAKRIHDRIAGVPPSPTVLDDMATVISDGNRTEEAYIEAAYMAMDHTAFYDVTLKNLAAPWTNEAMSSFVPLNDYTATIIGLVRDDADFRTILYGDVLYEADSSLNLSNDYSSTNNNHYEELEETGLSLKDSLTLTTQSSKNILPSSATAGVMTTRAAAKSFFKDGTNRAMFRFTALNHLCNDMEQLNDISRTPDRIRQDVSRSPGGDSKIFLNSCIGCHSGMDPLAQSFAYYEYDYDVETDPEGESGSISYNRVGTTDPMTGTRVQSKYHNNATNFEYGYVTPNDHWENYWREGQNKLLGWDSSLPSSGEGAKSMGEELANSNAFAECQVTKVFKNVCLRSPVDSTDRLKISDMVTSFVVSGYKLKQVFADSAIYCMGD
jgi:hypothetical protein